MKTFRAFLSEKKDPDDTRNRPSYVGYEEPKPDPLDTRGKWHIYNKSSKQVTTQHPHFQKENKAEAYLNTLAQRSREHLEVIYHDKSGGWHRVNNGIIDPVAVKVLNKKKR